MQEGTYSFSQPDELVTIATFESPTEVLFARSMLESAGIDCFVPDEHVHGATGGLYTFALGGMRLQVPMSQVHEATILLGSVETENRIQPEQSDEADEQR